MARAQSVRVDGIAETQAALKAIGGAAAASPVRKAAATLAADEARRIGPNRSGTLSASYRARVTGVASRVFYAHMVEYGTVHMAAQRRVSRAIRAREGDIVKVFDDGIEAAARSEGLL